MGKTYRRVPGGSFRHPQGHARALRQGCRKKAIPPNPYDDNAVGNEAWVSTRVARRLHAEGLSWDCAREKLRARFHLKSFELEGLRYIWFRA